MSVIEISGEYYGSGDSADDFEVVFTHKRTPKEQEEIQKLQKQCVELRKESKDWAFLSKGYEDIREKLHKIETEFQNKMYGPPPGVNEDAIRDVLYEIMESAGAVFMFDNEGCQGEYSWKLETNLFSVNSGYYEISRDNSGVNEDIFGVNQEKE